jgi:hypothetical protein
MTRESAVLAQELAIVLWLTVVANVGVWWFISSLLLESAHRERYGRYQTRSQLILDAMRHPLSAPRIIGRDWVAKYRAWYKAADDPSVELRRSTSWAAFGVYVAIVFFGLPVSFVLVAVVRSVLPGTVALWVVILNLILLAVWVRQGARGLASGSGRPLTVGGSVAGGLLCVLSAAVAIALWQAGGIAL